jgi:NitT/TauT family transport system ATP-binding protein
MGSIKLINVSKNFNRPDGATLEVLDRVSFEAGQGSFSSILGPSGCGKSTILSLIAGLEQQSSGTISVDGREVGKGQAGGPRMGFVFQRPRLLEWRTVTENVFLPLERTSTDRAAMIASAEKYLNLVGLEGYEAYYPAQLSGGMQQRVAIARALVIEPEILLMDEPFSGLDEMTARSMREELLRIWQETGKTILFVTHSIGEAVFLSQQILMVGRKPASIQNRATIDLPYPRKYGDLAMFELETRLTQDFLAMHPHPQS